MKTYRVKEIFGPTIQGEGSLAGTCVLFLRFSGCNRWSGREEDREKSFCKFCDTDFRGGTQMSAPDIITALGALGGPRRVVLTGGEPLLQLDLPLVRALRNAGYWLALETNGSKPLGNMLGVIDHVTMSPKQTRAETRLERATDLKLLFPLEHPEVTPEAFASYPCERRYLQPITDKNQKENMEATVRKVYANPEWRISLQTHKILGVQ